MALGNFTVIIDGDRIGGAAEGTAVVTIRPQNPAGWVKDSAAGKFHFKPPERVAVSLPYSVDLPTDVTVGESTVIGYHVEVVTSNGARVSTDFAAQPATTTVKLTDLTTTVVTPVSDAIAYIVEAEAARDLAQTYSNAAAAARDVAIASTIVTVAASVADGSADDRAAITTADTTAATAGRPVLLKKGTHRVSNTGGATVTINSPVMLQPGAKIKPDSGVTVVLAGGVVGTSRAQVFDHSAGGIVVPRKVERYYPSWWLPATGAAVDCTAGLNAAITAAYTTVSEGVVWIDTPMGWNGVITLPEGVVLRGPAATQPRDASNTTTDKSAGRLVALGAGCQIKVWDSTTNYNFSRGGECSDFLIDGAGYVPATAGLFFVAHSVSRAFTNIRVNDSGGVGVRVERCQNSIFTNVISSVHVSHALVLDCGAGNNLFQSCHFRACDGYNLYLDTNDGAAGGVTNTFGTRTVGNLFVRCNFENNHPTNGGTKPGVVRVPPGDTHPTRSLVELEDCAFAGGIIDLQGGRTMVKMGRINPTSAVAAIKLAAGAHLSIDDFFVEVASSLIDAQGGTADVGTIHYRTGSIPLVGPNKVTTGWGRRTDPPKGLYLDGTTGNGVSTPDSALNPTGSMSLIMYVQQPTYSPAAFQTYASIWNNTGPQRSWAWGQNTAGVSRFRFRNAADTANNDIITPALGLTSGQGYWRAVTFVGDDGTGTCRVRQFVSSVGPEQLPRTDQWVQVDSQTVAGAQTLRDTTEPLWIGSEGAGATTPMIGSVVRFIQTSDVVLPAGTPGGTPGSTITADFRGGSVPYIGSAGRKWSASGSAWAWTEPPFSGQ